MIYTYIKNSSSSGRKTMEKKKFKDLTIRDAFLFAAVMTDREICRKLLELSLEITIASVQVQTEKTMAYHSEYHGVRLDVYAADEKHTRYNVEMQVVRQDYLPKRSRYYHAQLDMDALLAGESYENLPDTYVIFICDFDPFGEGFYRYYTSTYCEETGKAVTDGVVTVYLNTRGEKEEGISSELMEFLNYVKNSGRKTIPEEEANSFIKLVQRHIEKIKSSRAMEERYMLLEEMLQKEKQEGILESIFTILESKFPVPEDLKSQMKIEKNPQKLKSWLLTATKATTLEDFRAHM